LDWDKTACRFVFSYKTWTWTWTCLFWRGLGLGLGLEDRGLGLGLGCCWTCYKSDFKSWSLLIMAQREYCTCNSFTVIHRVRVPKGEENSELVVKEITISMW